MADTAPPADRSRPGDDDRRYFRGEQSREEFREWMLGRIPRWYSPWAHLGSTVSIGVGALALAAWKIHALAPVELVAVPVTFVLSNVMEWHAHRNLLHRRDKRFKALAVLYDRHTPEHHRVYRYGDMEIRSTREMRLVLLPAVGAAGIVAMAAPAAVLAGALISPNVGWLVLATSSLYVVGYELSHLAYHLPETSVVYKLPFLKQLREQHARHHDPRLMQKWNFNVTLPLADWLFGTLVPPGLVDRIKATRATRQAPPGPGPAEA